MAGVALCLGLSTTFGANNLLSNPGFEDGQTGWGDAIRGGSAVVVTDPAGAHSGNNYSSNYNAAGWSAVSQGDSRGGWSTGVTIDVSDQKYYKLSAYVKVPGASTAPANITLRYRFEPSGDRVDVGQQTIATENWTLLESGWIAPRPGDTFVSYFEVHSVANGVVFYTDDCVLDEAAGTITGVVKDDSGNPVAGAQVQLKQSGTVLKTTTSLSDGTYTITAAPVGGVTYEVNASKLNYTSPADVSVVTVAPPGVATAGDIVLTALPTVVVSGTVTDSATSSPVPDAYVVISTVLGGSQSTTTDGSGQYSFTVAANETYLLRATKLPLSAPEQYIWPTEDQTVNIPLSSAMIVGLDAQNLPDGTLSVWTNEGTLGGAFVSYEVLNPVAGQSGPYRTVNLNDSPMILTNFTSGGVITAPPEITGASAYFTVSAWVIEPDSTLPDEQAFVSFSKRGGPDGSNAQFGLGANASYGAAGHWGAPDMGFATPPSGGAWHHVVITWNYLTGIESVYLDGVLSKSSPVKNLNISTGLPIFLGAGYWVDGADPSIFYPDNRFTGGLSKLEIFNAPATEADVAALYADAPKSEPIGTVAGSVVTADSSEPSGFAATVLDGSNAVVAQMVTAADGAYSLDVPPGDYTVKVVKTGFVTMPASQSATATDGGTTTVPAFTATPSSISGLLVDATTGDPIYNGVVQVGGVGGVATVTRPDGAYSLAATGSGGFEVFADALGYQARNLWFTNVGSLSKKIALTAQVETGITNGGFEAVTSGLPDAWIQGWDPTAPATPSIFWATDVPYTGANSAFVTGVNAYEPMSQFIPVEASTVYNCYFKARGTNMTGTSWFPMFAFRDSGFGEMKGWISGEPAPYEGWSHAAPTTWMQYLLFHTYSGDATRPFIRIAPPAGAAWLSASFCFSAGGLTSVQGVFVDDVVIDKVPASLPLEPAIPDTDTVAISIARVEGGVQLTWPEGTLLEAPTVNGAWTTNSATSPYTVTDPAGDMFYKLILP